MVDCCSSKIDADKLGEEESDGIPLAESSGNLFVCLSTKKSCSQQEFDTFSHWIVERILKCV